MVFSILIGPDLVGKCANYWPLAVICAQVAGNVGKNVGKKNKIRHGKDGR